MENRTKLLQWHPAFFAGIQVDLDARERKTRLAVNQEHARNMYNIGISVEQIALITKSSVETVNEWLNNKGA